MALTCPLINVTGFSTLLNDRTLEILFIFMGQFENAILLDQMTRKHTDVIQCQKFPILVLANIVL